MPKLVYVAGPYRSPEGIWGIHKNIEAAKEVARQLWMLKAAVICPHANTAFMDGVGTDDNFLLGDLVMVERCDLVVMLPNWEASSGARGERHHAEERGIPCFDWMTQRGDIYKFLGGPDAEKA